MTLTGNDSPRPVRQDATTGRDVWRRWVLAAGSTVPGASALTAAELRLLPLLTTHLSVPEIAADLVLSLHTIKSQMKSIYRKLDATPATRSSPGPGNWNFWSNSGAALTPLGDETRLRAACTYAREIGSR